MFWTRSLLPLCSLLSAGCLILSPALQAADYYVSTKGKDTNDGTKEKPWRTVQKAANTLQPGDTAFVRKGTYQEKVSVNVSGTADGGWITLRAYEGEKPVLDAVRLRPSDSGEDGIIYIRDQNHVRIQGLTLKNFSSGKADLVPSGIFVTGGCDHIELRDNRISRITTRSKTGNAFGIAIYGTSAQKPISNLIIDRNDVSYCKLGSSESLSLNGNVTGFEVTNNTVHHNNNIGIDFIGYEGTCPDAALDRARDGLCRGNVVHHISSFGNPAYGKEFSAGGIYVDGGARVLIERNVAHHCDIGVELASEHKNRTTEGVTLRSNVIYQNRMGGLFLGGYDAERGSTVDCNIHHNTLVQNDTRTDGNGEIFLQHYVTGCRFTHNLVVANKQKLFLGDQNSDSTNNTWDYNLYYATGNAEDAEWQKAGTSYSGLAAYRNATGRETHSLFVDPQLVSLPKTNFHLKTTSPAIGAGDAAFAAGEGETDLDGEARVKGERVDVGADEF